MIISKILLALSLTVAVLAAFMFDGNTITFRVAAVVMVMCYITGLISFLVLKKLAKSGRTKASALQK